MRILVSGTSNSLAQDGYVQDLREGGINTLVNFSAGIGTSAAGVYLLDDITKQKFDFWILDHSINDEGAEYLGICDVARLEDYMTIMIASARAEGAIPVVLTMYTRSGPVESKVRQMQLDLCKRLRVYYLDIYSLFRDAIRSGADCDYLMRDRVHMSWRACRIVGGALAAALRQIERAEKATAETVIQTISTRRIPARALTHADRLLRDETRLLFPEFLELRLGETLEAPVEESEVLDAIMVNTGAPGGLVEIISSHGRTVKNMTSYRRPDQPDLYNPLLMNLAAPAPGSAAGVSLRVVEADTDTTEPTMHEKPPVPGRYGLVEIIGLLVRKLGKREVVGLTTLSPEVDIDLSRSEAFVRSVGALVRLGANKPQKANESGDHPYSRLPGEAFWRSAVANVDPSEIAGVWAPKYKITKDLKFVTSGSCFAQHISRALVRSGFCWLDAEPAPREMSETQRADNGYGVFSFRVGNIYTCALLRQWIQWALTSCGESPEIWQENGRFYDPFRPLIAKGGFESRAALVSARQRTLRAIRGAVTQADVFTFTLGLTEGWRNARSGAVYPLCPGTVPGRGFDPNQDEFVNYSVAEGRQELETALRMMKDANPKLKFLLTVSPVPLTATASGRHVLVATTHSKSVLRAIAGELASARQDTDYFPSYEIVTAPPFGDRFFARNKREVSREGVDFVMSRFFGALEIAPGVAAFSGDWVREAELTCEDAALDAFNRKVI